MPENAIGTLREHSLHEALKAWYALPGDRLECPVDGYVIDIVREGLLVEIQTANFSAIRPKLEKLLPRHPVRLVYPVAAEKWILRLAGDGLTMQGRRRSPKRGRAVDVFPELVRIPDLVRHPDFSIEVVLVQEETVWRDDGRGSWRRRGRSIEDRRLLGVISSAVYAGADDFRALLPAGLPGEFTVPDLAKAVGRPRSQAGKMAYCLREMGAIERAGKRGRAWAYRVKTEK